MQNNMETGRIKQGIINEEKSVNGQKKYETSRKKEKIIGNRQKRNFRSDSFPFGWIPFRPVSIAPALRIPDLVFYGMSKAK